MDDQILPEICLVFLYIIESIWVLVMFFSMKKVFEVLIMLVAQVFFYIDYQ